MKKTSLLLAALLLSAPLSGCMTVVANNLGHEAMRKCHAVSTVSVNGGDWFNAASFSAACFRHVDR